VTCQGAAHRDLPHRQRPESTTHDNARLKVADSSGFWPTFGAERPSAKGAINADRAANAGHAVNADHATNADKLAGSPASAYLPSCPGNLKRAPKTDLCFDPIERSQATWTDALKTCALAGLRLPTAGELAQAFNDLDAVQDYQWTTLQYTYLNSAGFEVVVATLLAQDPSRNIQIGFDSVGLHYPFRCVTTAYN
jgi:hypothetical protein